MMKKIKIILFLTIILSLFTNTIYAQLGVGTEVKDTPGNISYDINIGGPTDVLSVDFSIKTVIQVNNGNGTLSIIPEGGTPPYDYFIYKNGSTTVLTSGIINGANQEITRSLPFGRYKVEIRDDNYIGNSTTCNTVTGVEVELKNPPELTIRGNRTRVVECKGYNTGEITAYVKGGSGSNTEGYTVQLLQGTRIIDTKFPDYSASTEVPVKFEGLFAGSYKIKVIDKYNVEKETTNTINLTDPDTFSVTSVNVIKNVSCNSGNEGEKRDGEIEVNIVGGTKPYNIKVKRVTTTEEEISTNLNKIKIDGLEAGTYTVEVKDAFECVRVFSFSRTINPPNEIQITQDVISKTSVSNVDGQVKFEVTGGTPPATGYSFEFNGVSYTAEDDSGEITISGGKYIANFTNLNDDDYTFKITDGNGCSESKTITIINPTILSIDNLVPTHLNCYNIPTGKIRVTASGGFQTSYRYQLFKKGSSTLLEEDTTNSGNATSNFDFTGLEAGEYTVKVAVIINDSGVDKVVEEKEDDVTITQASEIVMDTPIIDKVMCKGDNGKVTISASGGTGTLSYQWRKKGSIAVVSYAKELIAKAGVYDLTITDANTCSKIFRNIEIEEPTKALTVTSLELDLKTNSADLKGVTPDGRITVTAKDGWGGYRYQWRDSGGNLAERSNVLNNIKAGLYSVTVTDKEGCSIVLNNIEIEEPEPLNLTISYPSSVNEIKCNGDNNAVLRVDFNVKGPIVDSYKWYKTNKTNFISGLDNTPLVTDRVPDTYGVEAIVKNNRGEAVKIYATNDFEVKEPKLLVIDVSKTNTNNITCFGEKGSLDLFVKGGTAPYTYRLSRNGGSLEPEVVFNNNIGIPNLEQGNHSVEIKDANNCRIVGNTYNFSITEPTELIVTKLEEDKDATVFEKLDGVIAVKVEGGLPFNPTTTSHYNYVLTEKGSTAAVKSGVTVKNSSGEQVVELYDIRGAVLGKEYVLTIMDSSPSGCEKTTSHTIKEPKELEVNLMLDKHVNCFSGTDGQLSLTVEGGKTTDYRFEWFKKQAGVFISLGATKPTIIEAGEYKVNVAVVFEGNVTESKETNVIEVLQPTDIAVVETIQKVRCFNGNDGEIKLNVSGGVIGGGNATFTYSWSNGKDTKDISDLSAGDYTVTIDYNGSCRFTETYTIKEPTKELKVVEATFKHPTINVLDLNGKTPDGHVSVSVTDGRAPYVYKWTDESGNVVGTNSEKLENVGGGTYIVAVTDDNGMGCIKTFTKQLIEPAQFLVSIDPTLVTKLKCFGDTNGSIEATVEGGLTPYTYKWYKKLTGDVKEYIIAPKGTSQKLVPIGAGEYGVEVTDNSGTGITKSAEYELTQLEKLKIAYKVKPVTCFKGVDGEIDITVTGGTGNYTYSWGRGDTTEDLKGLVVGKYSVSVLDSNNCLVEEKDIEVTEPVEHKINTIDFITPTGAGKKDGKITISISGNTTDPYTLQWLNGDGDIIGTTKTIDNLKADNYVLRVIVDGKCTFEYKFPLTEPEKLIISIKEIGEGIQCYGDLAGTLQLETTGGVGGNEYKWFNANTDVEVRGDLEKVFNLEAGNYYVTVKDRKGNTAESDPYEIIQPPLLTVTTNYRDVLCFEDKNGFISIGAEGGTGKYYYSVSKDGGSYGAEVEFTDATVISNLDIGVYDVKVRDEKGCNLKELGINKILNFTITQPQKLEISEIVTDATGFGLENGNVVTTITGGTKPYSFSWKNASGNKIEGTKDIVNYGFGTYTLEVTDAQKCFVSKEITINQPDLLEVTTQQQNIVLCKGDETASINSTINGGVLPYQKYEWYKRGETDVKSITPRLNNIGIGVYYLIVTDAKNNVTQSDDITIEEPDFLTVDLLSKANGCGSTNDWTIEANVSGGTPPFKYFWSTGDTTKEITNQSLGNYFVVITDDNGCQITENIVIENNNIFTVTTTIKELVCFEACSGEIGLEITGGQAPYKILWSTGETTESIRNLCAGQYTVEIEDKNGCREVKTIELVNPEEFIFELIPDSVTLCLDEDIEYDVTMNNVSEYLWTSENGFTSTKSIVTLSEAGKYTLKVTTNEGCEVSRNLEILKSTTVIDAQLILTSQAFAGEDIAIINVSTPISDNVEWEIPSNVEIIQEENEGIVVKFPAPGDYEISLTSLEGNCTKKQTKLVTVLKERNITDIGDAETPFIEKYEAYSNPNKGKFKVDVQLGKEAEISLRLFGLGANNVTLEKILKGKKEYTVDYDTNVPSGIYILLLETHKTRKIIKIVIE